MLSLFRDSGRTLRAMLAVASTVALGFLFLAHQSEMTRAKEKAMTTVSATSWKVSELVFETFRLAMAMRLHATGEFRRSDLQLQYDLLWSRLDVLTTTGIEAERDIEAILDQYRDFLTQNEALVFDRTTVPPRYSISMARELRELAVAMRVAWVGTFDRDLFSGLAAAAPNASRAKQVQILIAVVMSFLVLYVIAEIAFAGVAHRREQELSRQAAAANEAKSRFLANVSHEIRTPLNGILGMASELAETRLNRDQKDCIKVIQDSGALLLHTINDVLDLSKVEAGAIVVEHEPFDLHQMLRAVQALYAPIARSKQVGLTLDIDANVPQTVSGDETRIRQVLHNLVSNALKFTQEGQVSLVVAPGQSDAGIRFMVVDTGPGIDASAQDAIFQPFSQADASITRKHGGTGLGLPISQQFVQAMGGALSLKSAPDEGAAFWFELDLPACDAVQIETVINPAPALHGRQAVEVELEILIVDDNATNRLILRRFLKAASAGLHEAEDGQQAVQAVARRAFDVVLMDVQMPNMDGIAATQRIRQLEAEEGRAPCHVIAVTANVMSEQTDEYLGNGMDAVLGKPVSKTELLGHLAAFARRATTGQATSDRVAPCRNAQQANSAL